MPFQSEIFGVGSTFLRDEPAGVSTRIRPCMFIGLGLLVLDALKILSVSTSIRRSGRLAVISKKTCSSLTH